MNKKIISGFTLLEILLALVIAGVLATIGASLLQQRAQAAKVEQTAQQIQLLLQAGSAYYIDQGAWPDSSQNLGTFSPYLPFQTNQNPWGANPYQYHATADNLKFQVIATGVPDEANKQLAHQIVALLPSAVLQNCEGTTCDIVAEVTVPPPGQSQSNYEITSIQSLSAQLLGSTTSTGMTILTSCPIGMIAKVEPALAGIQVDGTSWQTRVACGSIAQFPIYYAYFSNEICHKFINNKYICSFTLGATYVPGVIYWGLCQVGGLSGLGNITVTVISYCCKPGPDNQTCLPPT